MTKFIFRLDRIDELPLRALLAAALLCPYLSLTNTIARQLLAAVSAELYARLSGGTPPELYEIDLIDVGDDRFVCEAVGFVSFLRTVITDHAVIELAAGFKAALGAFWFKHYRPRVGGRAINELN